jgi:tRNA-modifying protein YgfZ
VSGTGATPGTPGILAEDYAALRHGAGSLSLARDVLRVAGPDAPSFLQGQVSQDLDSLEVGGAVDALLLTPQGKLDALVRVGRLADDTFTVDVEGGYGEAVAVRLARFKLRVKLDIDPLPWTCVAVRGPEAAAAVAPGVAASEGAPLVCAFSWNGVSGFDMLGEDPGAPAGARMCSLEAWEAVRVEAGIPAMGSELDERTIAAEADLLDRAVSLTKGCYTGQELVARLDARGNKVARHLRGLVVHPDRAGARGGAEHVDHAALVGAAVVVEERDVGTVTSAAWSPSLGRMVALAYVHRSVVVPAPVRLRLATGTVGASVVLASREAEVRQLPLV